MFLAKYNKATRVLKYINAGHNPPVLLQNGKSQLLDKGCTILGMFEELPFVNMQEITLEKGALIVTYTDGVTDLENESGELFSTERIVDTVIKNGDIAVEELNHRIFDEVIYFKGANEFVDDISILSCRMF